MDILQGKLSYLLNHLFNTRIVLQHPVLPWLSCGLKGTTKVTTGHTFVEHHITIYIRIYIYIYIYIYKPILHCNISIGIFIFVYLFLQSSICAGIKACLVFFILRSVPCCHVTIVRYFKYLRHFFYPDS